MMNILVICMLCLAAFALPCAAVNAESIPMAETQNENNELPGKTSAFPRRGLASRTGTGICPSPLRGYIHSGSTCLVMI